MRMNPTLWRVLSSVWFISILGGSAFADSQTSGGVFTPAGSYNFSGQESAPYVALTSGATITPPLNGSVVYTLNLGQNAKMACPSGGISSPSVAQYPVFLIVSNGFTLSWDTCYKWLNLNGSPALTPDLMAGNAAGATDVVSCFTVGAATAIGSIGCNFTPAMGYGTLVRANSSTTPAVCPSATSCAITIANVVAGDVAIIGVVQSGTVNDLTGITDSLGNTCGASANTFGANSTLTDGTVLWVCPITVGGASDVWTAAFSASLTSEVHYLECIGCASDLGLGNATSGNSANWTVAAAGPTTQPNQLVVALVRNASGTLSTSGIYTIANITGQGTAPGAMLYGIPSALATPSVPFSLSGAAQWTDSVTVLSHH